MLPNPVPFEGLDPVTPNCRKILQGFGRVQTDQAHTSLSFNVDQLNDAFIPKQSFRPRIFERLNHP